MSYKVFISSTLIDLRPYREAVSLALRKLGYDTSESEIWSAREQEPLEACLQEVANAELFVGIYAKRYGFVPPGSVKSITELELVEAERLRRPVFCFLVDEAIEWPAASCEEGEGARKLEALKRRIGEQRVRDLFRTPEDLASKVVIALTQWRERPKVSGERDKQLNFLDKVERIWIDGYLPSAVPEGRRLRIRRQERPDALGRPVLEGAVPETAAGEVIEPIHNLFLRKGKSLLLLGPPGSGKTVALLDLLRGLARVADRDPNFPLPVLFNLASWRVRDRGLADWTRQEQGFTNWKEPGRKLAIWMACELDRPCYLAGRDMARDWIRLHRILPLLDGLDEVEPESRQDCLDSIEDYLHEHGQDIHMAVACHTQVYEPARLPLETAEALLPLTPAQVDKHLETAGPALSGLRAALAGEPRLRELAASPLILVLLERTFRDAAPEDILSGLAAGQGRVFDEYVTRMLEPEREQPWRREETGRPRGWRSRLLWNRSRGKAPAPPPAGRYAREPTRLCLGWLARGMVEHDPAFFHVERLQPAWLTSRRQVFAYAVLSRALGGGLLALPVALPFDRPELAGAGVVAGALVGAVETRRLGRTAPPVAGGTGASLKSLLARTLSLGGTAFLVVLLLGIPWLAAAPSGHEAWRVTMLARVSLLFGLLFGGVFGSRAVNRYRNSDIRVVEALVWRSWSWRGTAIGASSLLGLSLALWGLLRLGADPLLAYLYGASFWIPFSLIVALLGGVLFGAFGGLGGRAFEKDAWPNQGIWLALRNAGVVGLITGLGTALVIGLALGGVQVAGGDVLPRGTLPWTPLRAGLALGVWVGLAYSGLDFVQHFSLRLILWLAKLAPARLVEFLDHAVDRGLLNRPGGSYMFFFHPELRDHFAQTYGAPSPTTGPTAP